MVLAEIFTDNLVFQRNQKIAIFGFGKGSGCIELCDFKLEFTSHQDTFCVYLPPQNAGGPYELKATLNNETTVLKNILIGDVYIAAGQSNIELPVCKTTDIPIIENSQIRLFTEPNDKDDYGVITHKEAKWNLCTQESINNFSAIGYYVAHILNNEIGIPIGIISCNKGASRIDAWTSPEIVNTEDYQSKVVFKAGEKSSYPFNENNWLYLNKFLNIVPYSACGVIWYQGESSSRENEAEYYCEHLKDLIDNWRTKLQNASLPFYLIQLMPYVNASKDWAVTRNCQEQAAKTIDNTYLLTLVDTNECDKIHPQKKKTISQKVANAILSAQHKRQIEYTGPLLDTITKTDTQIVLSFTHAHGLYFKDNIVDDLYLSDGSTTQKPNCNIVDNTLIIDIPKNYNIKEISMGYSNVPRHTLYNDSDFWASPFKIEL